MSVYGGSFNYFYVTTTALLRRDSLSYRFCFDDYRISDKKENKRIAVYNKAPHSKWYVSLDFRSNANILPDLATKIDTGYGNWR